MGSSDGVSVRLLGPTSVSRDGVGAPIRGRSLRRLMVRLALARGAAVPDRDLLVGVWGEGSGLPVLHTAVARLRRQLEPDRVGRSAGEVLIREGGGYLLRLARQGLDADRFVAAVRRGAVLLDAERPAEARAALDEGLSEWHGAACADAAGSTFAAAEIDRLDRLRVDAEELRAVALAALSDPVAAAELESFVGAHPLRERATAALVRLLQAEQRTADALAVLHRARRAARDAAGADLSEDLLALQRAILSGDPAPPVRPPRLLPTRSVPLPVSSLVGRAEELDGISARLRSNRLVTLTGPGGAGKTRLALESAGRRHDHDGPWFVDLADVHDGALLPERIARVLGGSAPTVAALTGLLGQRRALLVLDNCEQVRDAVAGLVERVLADCAGVAVLATSREALGIAGEMVVPVAPLSSGSEGDAVRLFGTRAAEAGRVPHPDELADVVALCAELDGLPLAIELAAARAGALSTADLRAGLADRFALLQREGRSGRHATMLGAVEWSYRLLDDDERDVYQALAVFRGGFRLDAAVAVSGRSDAPLLVARLAARSLVTVQEATPPRYRLLETMRDHAERSTPGPRRDELRARHLAWVRALASRSAVILRGRLSGSASAELQDETANIRHALAAADPDTVLRIGGGFYWFWYREGLVEEGLAHLLPAIEASRTRPDVDIADRCRSSMGAALLLYLRGDVPAAQAALAQAGSDAAACPDLSVKAQFASTLAYLEAGSGAQDSAQQHAEEALALARAADDGGATAESLMVLGEVARRGGDLVEAASRLRQAVEQADRSGYVWAGVSSRWIAAKVELQAGRLRSALSVAALASIQAQEADETTSWIVGLVTVAYLALVLGRTEVAGVVAGAASWLSDRIGFDPARLDEDLAGWSRALGEARDSPPFRDAYTQGRGITPGRLLDVLGEATSS